MNIYQTPESNIEDEQVLETRPSARKHFIFVVTAFFLNWILAGFVIGINQLDDNLNVILSVAWLLATILYSIFAGLYFANWGKRRALWLIAILLLQPVSLLVTFPYILFRAYKHKWHSRA